MYNRFLISRYCAGGIANSLKRRRVIWEHLTEVQLYREIEEKGRGTSPSLSVTIARGL